MRSLKNFNNPNRIKAKKGKCKSTKLNTATLASGITLEYAERGKSKNGKHTVIFLHGFLDSWFSFSQIMENFSAKYHCISVSLRGHGESSKPATGYDMKDFATDVLALLDILNIDKANFVGHSMGAMTALRIAIDKPERVNKMALIGPGYDLTVSEVLIGFSEFAQTLTDPIDLGFLEEVTISVYKAEYDPDFVAGQVSETAKVPANVWREAGAGLLRTKMTPEELGKIKAKTRIIWGELDDIFPRSDEDALVANIPGSKLSVYEGSGHGVQWEFPDEVTEELLDFLK